MRKTLTMGIVLVGALSSPALALVESGNLAAQCREQAYSMWQRGRNGDGLDRQRAFITNSCMANGHKPWSQLSRTY